MALVAPAWEAPARAIARAAKLPESQIITLPLGELFADSTDAAQRMRETAGDLVPLIEKALKASSPVPAR
ncbi:MAG: hypothetical protein HYX92_04700 [Chloroflexi bacterium]|nr:hypothetical protein [Chloroflexota bacterium]